MVRFAVGDDDQALDVVQDTMLEFVRRYRDKPEQEWPPLFFKVLQSKISDAHRRRSVRLRCMGWLTGNRQEDDPEDLIQEVADPRNETPLRLLEQAQLGKRLDQVIRELPLRQQQAFLLRCWEGLDVAETAQAMGCSEGSVKTHYFRAVQSLRQKLEEYQS
jgi:RNA polymerase sigma-70 factor, ECF subfamily